MGVSKKHQKKIRVDGRLFIWSVHLDEDSPHYLLRVISDDKRFHVQYLLGLEAEVRHITVVGREFGTTVPSKGWRRFRCPRWENEEGAVTPKSVKQLIEWSLQGGHEREEVDYRGHPV